jgi:hypothetical protein
VGALLQHLVDPVDLLLIVSCRAPRALVEKIQECQRALRIDVLGGSQLPDDDGPKLWPGGAVSGLSLLYLGDRFVAGITQAHVTIALAGVLAPELLDECPLAIVRDAGGPGCLRVRDGHSDQNERDQPDGGAEHSERSWSEAGHGAISRDPYRARWRNPVTACTKRSGCSYGSMWPAPSIISTRAPGISAFQRAA